MKKAILTKGILLLAALGAHAFGQDITTITAKMESKIEFQSHGKYEDSRMVTGIILLQT